ncbi:LutC/YkgG family protein [Varunaivibrio sulfuroxidans]|nr:lactate utilization protein C [Varunaivibrio sulfuroxidans]WES29825.1 lactate utilization protein C [Varunaivibrio sulfuroxidans]
MCEHPAGPRPAHGVPASGDSDGRADIFIARAQRAGAQTYRVSDISQVPTTLRSAIERYALENPKFPPLDVVSLRLCADPRLTELDWINAGIAVQGGRAQGADRVSLSYAFAGVAETGTAVLLSGAEQPTTLNFLPEVHVVLVEKTSIVSHYEDAWMLIRKQSTQPPILPRTINWITGPSRTADIEQTLLMGAHGPRHLIVVIVDAKS